MGAPSASGRHRLLVNATELLRQPGTVRSLATTVALADVDVHDERVRGDVDVDVALTSSLDDIEVEGSLSVAWSDQCRRCLAPLAGTLSVDVHERYAPEPADPGAALDPDVFPIEHGQLDLAPMVREEVLLGIPDAPLCRADCAGICPTCGADLAGGACACAPAGRDERWAILDQLRGDEPG